MFCVLFKSLKPVYKRVMAEFSEIYFFIYTDSLILSQTTRRETHGASLLLSLSKT
jgi:hypothetical protein